MMEKEVQKTILYQSENQHVDRLYELYREDPFKARVAFQYHNLHDFTTECLALFEDVGTPYFRVIFDKCFIKITDNNKIVKSYSKMATVTYTKNGLYLKEGSFLKHLCIDDRLHKHWEVWEILYDKFPQLEYLRDIACTPKSSISVTTILKKKLSSAKKLYKYLYKYQDPKINSALVCFQRYVDISGLADRFDYKQFHKVRKCLNNVQAILDNRYPMHYFFAVNGAFPNTYSDEFKSEMKRKGDKDFDYALIVDLLLVSFRLGVPVNCKWSVKRMKLEHDRLSKIEMNCLYDFADEELIISDVFRRFDKEIKDKGFNDLVLIENKQDLFRLSYEQKHCVYSYWNKVNSGRCAIFEFKNKYTVDIDRKLIIEQARGFSNSLIDDMDFQELNKKVDIAKENVDIDKSHIPASQNPQAVGELDDLPF